MDRDGAHIPFVESASYPIRGGNRVRPLVDGEAAFRRICEAVEGASHSVWVTIAFLDPAFEMPDARGSLLDVLDAARARSLDVRALFWRSREVHAKDPTAHFPGDPAQRAALRRRGSRFLARWDQAAGDYCHHQKSWIVDAGRPGEVAFVGGINPNRDAMVVPGHAPNPRGRSTHDVYLELRGPSASDVHHNFVQRWNEASDRERDDGVWPDGASQPDLPFPTLPGPQVGDVAVQIQRTVHRDRYTDGTPAPGGAAFAIAAGERSILQQHRVAIAAARRTLYLEHQALGSLELLEALHAALARGVDIVLLAPADPEAKVTDSRSDPRAAGFWKRFVELGAAPGFTLAGIAANGPRAGVYQHAYVHAKLALVDDVWATIGSANLHERSLRGHTELNASFWHGPTVADLRRELLVEHLGRDTADVDDLGALRLYARIARENAARRARGEPLEGLAFALQPQGYGR